MVQQDFRTIHEAGMLQDIMKMVAGSDIPYLSDIGNRILGNNSDPNKINISRNIAKSAAALTATFPVIVTEATQLEHAVMVSKSIERKAVEMLRMLFAANQITNVTGAQQYLNKFHNNIDTGIDYSSMDVDDVIDHMNKITESGDPNTIVAESKELVFEAKNVDQLLYVMDNLSEAVIASQPEMEQFKRDAVIAECTKMVLEDTKANIHHVLETGINEVSIREYKCRGGLNEADVWKTHEDNVLNELTSGASQKVTSTTSWDGNADNPGFFNNARTQRQIEISDPNDVGNIKSAFEIMNKGVIKTDVQKANEAVPSMVVINFVSTIPGGSTVNSTAVIGVKAVLHYVKSEDMVNRIVLKHSDKRGLLNFIRATTREISFFNDFLFAVKRAKIDAIARSGKGSNSKIWKILELRAHRSNLNRAAGKNNTDCAAITSIIISKAEVDYIKKEHRIDLSNGGTMVGIMRGYNLMCAVIVDDVAERVDFMYDDGDKNYETLSFMALEREDSNGQLKKVINVLASKGR